MGNFSFSVNVYPINSSSKLKAFASVIIEDVMEIKGFKIFESSKGLFVSVPSTKGTDKEGVEKYWADVIFHEETNPEEGIYDGPCASEVKKAIIDKYKAVAGQNSRGNAASAQTKCLAGS